MIRSSAKLSIWKLLTFLTLAIYVLVVDFAIAPPHLAEVRLVTVAIVKLAVRILRAVAAKLTFSCRKGTNITGCSLTLHGDYCEELLTIAFNTLKYYVF